MSLFRPVERGEGGWWKATLDGERECVFVRNDGDAPLHLVHEDSVLAVVLGPGRTAFLTAIGEPVLLRVVDTHGKDANGVTVEVGPRSAIRGEG